MASSDQQHYREVNLTIPEWCHVPCGETQYICYECGHVSNSTKGWWNHRANAHGFTRDIRSYISGECCRACPQNFHTLPRLIRHITVDSPACQCHYFEYLQPLYEEVLQATKAEYASVCRSHRAQGLPGNGRTALRDPERYAGPRLPTIDPASCDLKSMQIQPIPLVDPVPTEQIPAPPVFTLNYYLIVHLFSGQRRQNDIQDHLETVIAERARPIIVMSLDIINNRVRGDRANGKIVIFWIQHVMCRRVLATIGGPPYETRSADRTCPLSGKKLRPLLLRSAEHPWGVLGLPDKYYKQLQADSALMRTMICFSHASYAAGVIAVMAHPQSPSDVAHCGPASC